ncbi:hypothetical protein [Laspinema palackyanum]|uniref:hypothetical protein n=1 Tax=Laspinema palackyanum TaxID=3231601 RepID=UPI00345CA72E|nr:hypothetical protein [Laspinema sp. D2c]
MAGPRFSQLSRVRVPRLSGMSPELVPVRFRVSQLYRIRVAPRAGCIAGASCDRQGQSLRMGRLIRAQAIAKGRLNDWASVAFMRSP